jgi:hypothetical protein
MPKSLKKNAQGQSQGINNFFTVDIETEPPARLSHIPPKGVPYSHICERRLRVEVNQASTVPNTAYKSRM